MTNLPRVCPRKNTLRPIGQCLDVDIRIKYQFRQQNLLVHPLPLIRRFWQRPIGHYEYFGPIYKKNSCIKINHFSPSLQHEFIDLPCKLFQMIHHQFHLQFSKFLRDFHRI